MAKLTNEEFHNRLKNENPDVLTDTIYINANTMLNCRCKYNHSWKASARNVLWNHTKCPYCSGSLPIKGVNDLWTTHPELAKLLKNPEDGYNVSYGSSKKVWWICPNCKTELFKTVYNVVNKGLSCNNCSDMFSFPNRFMSNLLRYINIEFQPEYIIKGRNYENVRKAPAMLLTIIDRKLGYYGEKLIEINTFETKASQFNHFDGTYTKKSLSQRWNDFNGIKIQRDIYSAFLIMNISDDLKSFDIDKCNERFENFYLLHNLEVNRLTGKKNLSSIAI